MENWCIIGDFNGVRKLEEIIGGEGVNGIEGRGEIVVISCCSGHLPLYLVVPLVGIICSD